MVLTRSLPAHAQLRPQSNPLVRDAHFKPGHGDLHGGVGAPCFDEGGPLGSWWRRTAAQSSLQRLHPVGQDCQGTVTCQGMVQNDVAAVGSS